MAHLLCRATAPSDGWRELLFNEGAVYVSAVSSTSEQLSQIYHIEDKGHDKDVPGPV